MDFKSGDAVNGKALGHWLTWFNRQHKGFERCKSEHCALWSDTGPLTQPTILLFNNDDNDRPIGMTHLDGRCVFYD